MNHEQINNRQRWLSTLAKSPEQALLHHWSGLKLDIPYEWVRPPEVGSVMVQGRTGSSGNAFNLGEVTVTRCSLKLSDGTVGHGYHQGRNKAAAQVVALCDALLQQGNERIEHEVVQVLHQAQHDHMDLIRRKAAATKVDFFTLVRGDD